MWVLIVWLFPTIQASASRQKAHKPRESSVTFLIFFIRLHHPQSLEWTASSNQLHQSLLWFMKDLTMEFSYTSYLSTEKSYL